MKAYLAGTLIILFGFHSSFAQLNPGDLVFSGYNSDSAEEYGFSFIATTTISAGEVIHFTDNGWLSGTNTFRTNEDVLSYTVPAGGLSLGSQVSIEDVTAVGNAFVASDGGSITHYGRMVLGKGRDQIFAFSGSVTDSVTFSVTGLIAGLQFKGSAFDADATNNATSALPPTLTLGTDAVAMSPSRDNGRLGFDTNFLSGTAATIKSTACDNSNWDHSNNNQFTIPPLSENTWNGTSWSSGSAPGSSENATISNGESFSVSSNITIGEVTLENNATLSVDSGVTLTISGDLTNNGSISGKGTISFDKNASIARTRGDTTTFGGIINVTSGTTLQTNGRLRLTASSSTSYGMISGSGTVSGDVYIQCYLDLAGGASDGRYYQLASPITNTTFADFNEGQVINVSSGTGSVWQWDAANSNWAAPASSASTVENGRGYAIFAGSNTSGDFLIAEAGTIELIGTVTTSDVTYALAYNDGQALNVTFVGGTSSAATEGWNLLGNPYASQYDWNGQTRPSGLSDAIYIYQGTSNFATYVSGVGANNGTRYIAPFQAFWVQTTNSSPGNFTFEADQRVRTQATELFKTIPIDGVHLQVNSSENLKDEIFIGFDNQASSDFDGDYDAWKLSGSSALPNIYSKIGVKSYSINRVKKGDLSSFDIGFQFEDDGDLINIHLKDDALKSYGKVVLEDLKLSVLHNLSVADYSFIHDTSYAPERFVLHFLDQQVISTEEGVASEIYIYSSDNGFVVQAPEAENAVLEVYNIAGQLVYFQSHFLKEDKVPVNAKGIYLIRLIEGDKITALKTAR